MTFHAPLDLTIHDSQGMYDPGAEHDACGVGMVTTLNKRPERKIVDDAIEVLVNLNHRGAVGAEENTGDGAGILMSMLTLIPSALMFIGFGLIFGVLFNEKSAPGLCSIIISLGGFFGSIWFDAESTGGVMLKLCKCMPFLYCTRSARLAVTLDMGSAKFLLSIGIVLACAVLLITLGSFAFSRKMRADLG